MAVGSRRKTTKSRMQVRRPEQGVTIFTGAENCQSQPTCDAFPADSRLQIAETRNVIGGPAGAVSFWLEPQCDAEDSSSRARRYRSTSFN
jgi:hypothetical protein